MGTPYGDFIRFTFDRFKRKSQFDPLISLPVYNSSEHLVAYLRPIIQEFRATDPQLGDLISQWHIANPTISSATFRVTPERTLRWLDHFILARADRLLFLVETIDGKKIGHLGYSNFDFENETGEIDSVLRGLKGSYPGLMTFAVRTLIRFGKTELRMKQIRLSVFSDSERPLNFYRRLGFEEWGRKPLYRVYSSDESKLEIAPPGYPGPIEKYYVCMAWRENDLRPLD